MAKKKNNRTAKQYLAALENLKKARAAKARYRELRSEGFSSKNIDEIVKATDTINDMMYRFRTYHVENNPRMIHQAQFRIRFVKPIRFLSAGDEKYPIDPGRKAFYPAKPVSEQSVIAVAVLPICVRVIA